MKIIKKLLLVLLVALVIIQFFKPEPNDSNDTIYAMATKYEIPESVDAILTVSCIDCHSNNTTYPWYSKVQPAAWWLDGHVQDGKKHLNFSEFTNRRIAIQNHKFEEIIEMVEDKEMPLPSYTYLGLHSDAKLSDDQRIVLTDWAKAQMSLLKKQYPADSLVLRRR